MTTSARPAERVGSGGDCESRDAELVSRARAGDRGAIVALYQRYVREIYGYVYNQIGVAEEAEDVTSEIFLRFVQSLPGFAGRSSVRTWLYAIARNRLRDRWRAAARRPECIALEDGDGEGFSGRTTIVASAGAPLDPRDPPSPEREPAHDEIVRRATPLGEQILAALPPRYRQVLELRVMAGRSIRDAAEAMETTPGNVKVLQHRALKRALEVATELGLSPVPGSMPGAVRSPDSRSEAISGPGGRRPAVATRVRGEA